jgi:hypothetical protein
MWFDARAKLAEITGQPPATSRTQAPAARPVSQMSQVSQPPEPRKPALNVASVAIVATPPARAEGLTNWRTIDAFEERAAILEYEAGMSREVAETLALEAVRRAFRCDSITP